MTEQDIETVRAQYREGYHRKTAARRAKGLCVKCGKCPPTPGRTRCEPCAEKQRAADLERYHRRTAERVAQGLCPKCGKRPPAPERSQCEPCLEKDAAAGRARDARLRAAGVPRRDAAKTREYERERTRRQTEARQAEGLCTACGKDPAVPRPRVLRALPGEAPRLGPRQIRGRQGSGEAVRRSQRRGQAPRQPRQERAAQEGVARGGAVRPLRQAPGGGGRHDLHALPGEAPGEGAPQIRRAPRRRALHEVRRPRLRRPVLLRPLRRSPQRRPLDGDQERGRETEVCRAPRAPASAPTAASPPRAPPVAPRARSIRITAPRISGASRSGTRAGR